MANRPARPMGCIWDAPLALLVVVAAAAVDAAFVVADAAEVVTPAGVVVAPATTGVVDTPTTTVDVAVTEVKLTVSGAVDPATAVEPWEAEAVRHEESPDPAPTVMGPEA